jgi:putative SOS response-associated peptidase YedK
MAALKNHSSDPIATILFGFAGIWREWEGTRGTKTDPATGTHLLFSFLTTSPAWTLRRFTLTPRRSSY